MKTAGIIVNYYREDQKSELEPGIIPHFNEKCTRYFEAEIQRKLHAERIHDRHDYIGVVSWKMTQKTRVSPATFKRIIEEDPDAPDFYWAPAFGCATRMNVWAQGEFCQPGLIQAAKAVLHVAGINPGIIMLDTEAIWCQTYAARREVFDVFMRECMLPCLAAMDDPRLEPWLMRDGGYSSPGVDAERMKSIFGVPHYTLHPAIVERLFPSVAAAMGLRGKCVTHDSPAPQNEPRQSVAPEAAATQAKE